MPHDKFYILIKNVKIIKILKIIKIIREAILSLKINDSILILI
jgi:hypothetical protein